MKNEQTDYSEQNSHKSWRAESMNFTPDVVSFVAGGVVGVAMLTVAMMIQWRDEAGGK